MNQIYFRISRWRRSSLGWARRSPGVRPRSSALTVWVGDIRSRCWPPVTVHLSTSYITFHRRFYWKKMQEIFSYIARLRSAPANSWLDCVTSLVVETEDCLVFTDQRNVFNNNEDNRNLDGNNNIELLPRKWKNFIIIFPNDVFSDLEWERGLLS